MNRTQTNVITNIYNEQYNFDTTVSITIFVDNILVAAVSPEMRGRAKMEPVENLCRYILQLAYV